MLSISAQKTETETIRLIKGDGLGLEGTVELE
jgi:hypothetical protein